MNSSDYKHPYNLTDTAQSFLLYIGEKYNLIDNQSTKGALALSVLLKVAAHIENDYEGLFKFYMEDPVYFPQFEAKRSDW